MHPVCTHIDERPGCSASPGSARRHTAARTQRAGRAAGAPRAGRRRTGAEQARRAARERDGARDVRVLELVHLVARQRIPEPRREVRGRGRGHHRLLVQHARPHRALPARARRVTGQHLPCNSKPAAPATTEPFRSTHDHNAPCPPAPAADRAADSGPRPATESLRLAPEHPLAARAPPPHLASVQRIQAHSGRQTTLPIRLPVEQPTLHSTRAAATRRQASTGAAVSSSPCAEQDPWPGEHLVALEGADPVAALALAQHGLAILARAGEKIAVGGDSAARTARASRRANRTVRPPEQVSGTRVATWHT